MMAVVNVNAQDETKNEFGVFYGTGSASDILSYITSSISAAAGDQSSFWGPVGAEYYYHVSPGVALGAVGAFAVSCNDNAKAADPKAKDETLTTFMFQATALGMDFGGEQFRGFVEAGIGEKGLLCAGLRYKF